MSSNPNWEFFHDNSVAKHDPAVGLGSPRPLGRVVFDVPALTGATYEAWQEFANATTRARYTTADGAHIGLVSWVAAQENVLVVEFTADRDTSVSVDFHFPDELGKGCDAGVDVEGLGEGDESLTGTFVGLVGGKPVQLKSRRGGIVYGSRTFSDGVDVPTAVGFGGRFVGEDGLETTIRAGETLRFVLPLRSWAKVSRPMEYARSRAAWITESDVMSLWEQHTSWWRDYWRVSGVQVEDQLIEEKYYLGQFMMGCLSRDPDYPPNILGISTFDRMAWNGNYKVNYNHQSPYLALLAAGHFEQADTHDAPYLAMLDIGREMSRRLLGHEGVYLPLGLGPAGMVSEALLLYMKSPAVHGAINMLIRYRLTLDRAYLRRVYPFLHAVAQFWELDLVEEGGRYRIVGDGMHERVTSNVQQNGLPENPSNTLGYLRTFFRQMADASRDLGIDDDERERWLHIAAHLSPYPVGVIGDIVDNVTLWNEGDRTVRDLVPESFQRTPVFFNEEKGGAWSLHFPGNIMQIYPGGAIGLESPEEELTIARNTVHALALMEDALGEAGGTAGATPSPEGTPHPHFHKAGAWNAVNLSCLFFPAAVRVGYDPEVVWQELKDRLTHRGMPNGFIAGNPHGIENLSTVPNTVQEMMLLSHEGILRFFRGWPKRSQPAASFTGLWAYGAFVVDAALEGGEVATIELESRSGGACRIENPWPGRSVRLQGPTGECFLTGDVVEVPTTAMGRYRLTAVPG
ncbi:glycosyl hydrolase family 95 catalytic domain-containing protein [Pseudactinotalea sp.]|uniref:glycosyl hydrolase family 95 catalytic domain-containing protein n=1 Tax=Pseudactinotalea sp. TaxID=1926260 RepID=UPI003B3B2BA2